MKKVNTSPISGMQELSPATQAIFNQLKHQIATTYRLHGFLPVETPIIERTDILLAKAGGDTEKQIYKVVKTHESADSADQALRFDHTVPLARYVVEHENTLTFPFKVSQIGRNFRGERAQKGRFREFYQLDADVVGRESLPLAYDAEVISTACDALKTFIRPKMLIRISNRKILSGIIEELNLSEKSASIFSIIDHAEKVPKEKTLAAFAEIGLTDSETDLLLRFMAIHGQRSAVIEALNSLNIENALFAQGVAELDLVLSLLESRYSENLQGDMLIVRGLDYYTGTVFETFLPDYAAIGSICSGGRYDNLASHYTENHFPGVGVSIGLTRLFYVLNEYGLLENPNQMPADYVLIPLSSDQLPYTNTLADTLRTRDGAVVDINLSFDKKLGDRIKYASKIANFMAVIGEDEVNANAVTVKNLQTGETSTLK